MSSLPASTVSYAGTAVPSAYQARLRDGHRRFELLYSADRMISASPFAFANAFMVTEHSTVVVKNGLTAADLGGEAVVLDPHTGRYYGLNELGARIFELSQKPRSVDRIMTALLQEYDVAAEQLKTDVVAFLREMESRELIEITDGAPA